MHCLSFLFNVRVFHKSFSPVGETSWSRCNRAARLPGPRQKVPLEKTVLRSVGP